MTNIEKVKRILDAGHWVKVTYKDGTILNITSNYEWIFTYINPKTETVSSTSYDFKDCTIEVIQRIPTPYKAWDKVLVLSNPNPDNKTMDSMVWNVCEVMVSGKHDYTIWVNNKYDAYRYFPSHCLSPVFEEDSLSGKEAKIVIDGKEYTCTINYPYN